MKNILVERNDIVGDINMRTDSAEGLVAPEDTKKGLRPGEKGDWHQSAKIQTRGEGGEEILEGTISQI